MLFDQLVAAGCVRRIQAAWVGNVSGGLGHNYRRAVERGVPHPIEVEDHSNLTMAAALQAGALGAPYMPDAVAARHGPPRLQSVLQAGARSVFRRSRGAHPRPHARRGHPARPARGRGRSRALLGHPRHHAPGRARREARHHRGRGDPLPRDHAVRSRPRAGARPQGRGRRPRALRRLSVTRAGLLPPRPRLLPPLPRGVAHRGRNAGVARSLGVRGRRLEGLPRAASAPTPSARCASPLRVSPNLSTMEREP